MGRTPLCIVSGAGEHDWASSMHARSVGEWNMSAASKCWICLVSCLVCLGPGRFGLEVHTGVHEVGGERRWQRCWWW